MKIFAALALVGLLATCAFVWNNTSSTPGAANSFAEAPRKDTVPPAQSQSTPNELTGRTQTAPGRRSAIAPVPLHPVTEVLVKPGDRVKKGQVLVKLDDDEAQADVRVKQAALDGAQALAEDARRIMKTHEELFRSAALPANTLSLSRTARLKAEADERSARAALDSAKAELEHYTVNASIDGVVAWLDVHPGTVSRPGTTLWGEILDLSEIDIRCELPAEDIEQVSLGQTAAVRHKGKQSWHTGTVVFIGIAADKQSGHVPFIVRVANSSGQFRCDVSVQVRLTVGD